MWQTYIEVRKKSLQTEKKNLSKYLTCASLIKFRRKLIWEKLKQQRSG